MQKYTLYCRNPYSLSTLNVSTNPSSSSTPPISPSHTPPSMCTACSPPQLKNLIPQTSPSLPRLQSSHATGHVPTVMRAAWSAHPLPYPLLSGELLDEPPEQNITGGCTVNALLVCSKISLYHPPSSPPFLTAIPVGILLHPLIAAILTPGRGLPPLPQSLPQEMTRRRRRKRRKGAWQRGRAPSPLATDLILVS